MNKLRNTFLLSPLNLVKIIITVLIVHACKGSDDNTNMMVDSEITSIAQQLHSYLFELESANKNSTIEKQISKVENAFQKQALENYLKSIESQNKANMQDAFVQARIALQSIESQKYQTPLFYLNLLYHNIELARILKKNLEASSFYIEAITPIDKLQINDKCLLSKFYGQIGRVAYNQKLYNQASEYLKKSISFSDSCKDQNNFEYHFTYYHSLNTLALNYTKQNKLDSAEKQHILTLEYLDKNIKNNPDWKDFYEITKGLSSGNLGYLYLKNKKYRHADSLLQKDIELSKGIENMSALYASIALAESKAHQGEILKAKTILDSIAEKIDSPSEERLYLLQDYYKTLAVIKEKEGKYKEAHHALIQSYHYADSVLLNSNLGSLNDDYFVLDYIQTKNQLSEEKIQYKLKQKSFYLYNSIIFIILLMLVSLILYRFIFIQKGLTKNENSNIQINNNLLLYHEVQDQLSTEKMKLNNLIDYLQGDARDSINSIQSICEYYIQNIDQKSNSLKEENIYIIYNKCQYLNDIIDSIDKNENNYLHLNKEYFQINTLIYNCIKKCKSLADQKNIRISMIEKDRVKCFFDYVKIEDLIIQILKTALNFSHDNDEIEMRISKHGNHAVITVRDYGLGMSDRTIYGLYSNQMMIDKEELYPMELSDFNFQLGRKIAKAHQGLLVFESKKGFGTLYTLRLPLIV